MRNSNDLQTTTLGFSEGQKVSDICKKSLKSLIGVYPIKSKIIRREAILVDICPECGTSVLFGKRCDCGFDGISEIRQNPQYSDLDFNFVLEKDTK